MTSLKDRYQLSRTEQGPVDAFWEKPCMNRLSRVPKELQTSDMVEAVIHDYQGWRYGFLKYISRKASTYEQCKLACSMNGADFEYVRKRFKTEELALISLKTCYYVIKWLPQKLQTIEFYRSAVETNGSSIACIPMELRSYDLCLTAVRNDALTAEAYALASVPGSILKGPGGRYLCLEAIKANGKAVKYAPSSYITDEICLGLLYQDPSYALIIPSKCLSRKTIVDVALNQLPSALRRIPLNMRTETRCFTAIAADPEGVKVSWFPAKVRAKWETLHPEAPEASFLVNADEAFDHQEVDTPFTLPAKARRLPEPIQEIDESLMVSDAGQIVPHSLVGELAHPLNVYYISDIHIEHQLPLNACTTLGEAKEMIRGKVSELLSALPYYSLILVGGDVADNIELESLFYETLVREAKSLGLRPDIIAVVGNHELWTDGVLNVEPRRSADQIVEDYKKAFSKALQNGMLLDGALLENQLYIRYRGKRHLDRVINEKDILACNDEELRELCEDSTLLVLGGLGYSGLNPIYNADCGYYRDVISREEDVSRSERFLAVHDKLRQCANNRRVIVLTHTPLHDWLPTGPNANWIYINGHTHQNGLLIRGEGPTVLFDNQVGYDPKPWHFNSFDIDGSYNPLEKLEDGVHEISVSEYQDFNIGRGICVAFNRAGKIYVAKRGDAYMFLLVNKSKTYLLEGGRIHRLDHDVNWYFEHMGEYVSRVRKAFAPYQECLKRISNEIRSFGGTGKIHGCIVDIDFWTHIYLDPYTGKATPYFAESTSSRSEFSSVKALLSQAAQEWECFEPLSERHKQLLARYSELEAAGKMNLLGLNKANELVIVDGDVLDRSMYEPSRIMRSIQYVFDDGVIRIWRDQVLRQGASQSEIDDKRPSVNERNVKGLLPKA
ncbi:metallophosphoesterase [Paratractidigestivibacter sp.]|uniref:metallophosphoesterase n=1 Tax=Paratractidigestivibacter sp. TaxID=2847316 RepID=UPI002AC8AB8B|nr:metallophosphoesterase [Paratractidigestivibacter sp.]